MDHTKYIVEKIINSKIELHENLQRIKPIMTWEDEIEFENKIYGNLSWEEEVEILKDGLKHEEKEEEEYNRFKTEEVLHININIIERIFVRLYNQVLVLVEISGFSKYREDVILQLDKYIKQPIQLLNTIQFEEETYTKESEKYAVIIDLEKVLSPFDFSETKEIEALKKARGFDYLENIISNTSQIIENLKLKPEKEAEVYKAIEFVINSIFPSSINNPKGVFLSQLKSYVPDVIIPELGVAIEYKLAKDEKTLKNTIDQISTDVLGYKLNSNYKFFYAVFYVKGDAKNIGKLKFEKHIETLGFPKNWYFRYIPA